MKELEPRILIVVSCICSSIWSHQGKSQAALRESMSSWITLTPQIKINTWWQLHLKSYSRIYIEVFLNFFMVEGHTKFAPDRQFALMAKACNSADVVNEKELIDVMENHASVTFYIGCIVRCWRNTVSQKYSNLPGKMISLHWRILEVMQSEKCERNATLVLSGIPRWRLWLIWRLLTLLYLEWTGHNLCCSKDG